MPVKFRSQRLYAVNDAFTVEDAFTAYAAFAGILKTKYDSLVDVSSLIVDKHTQTAGWKVDWNATVLPASFFVRYHKEVLQQGIAVGIPTNYWLITTDVDGNPAIYRNAGGGLDLKQTYVLSTPTVADVKIAFRQIQMSDDEKDIWVTLSIWMNDKWITSYTERTGETLLETQIGFAALGSGGAAITYQNIHIPELCDYNEYGTLDPGENAMGGLQRAIDGRYLRFYLRATGELRAWKVKPVVAKGVIPDRADYTSTPRVDLRGYVNHVRVMGAYTWEEAVDPVGISMFGDRFAEVNNPMLLTSAECRAEAAKQIQRFTEAAFTKTMQLPFIPFIEVEDRITAEEGGDWIISENDLDFQGGTIDQNLELRAYVWGEPNA